MILIGSYKVQRTSLAYNSVTKSPGFFCFLFFFVIKEQSFLIYPLFYTQPLLLVVIVLAIHLQLVFH